jgi:hypothetical protein
MTRRILPLALILLVAVPLSGRTRSVGRASDDARLSGPGTIASGIVTAVNGNLISLADGLVTIDATNAKLTIDRGQVITAGMMVMAVIGPGEVAANAPLPAVSIAVTRLADVTVSGAVQSVDVPGSTLTILGRAIRVTSETSFGGFGRGNTTRGLPDILPNHVVHVQANAVNGVLVADFVQIVAPMPPPTLTFRGKVKSISADQWVITSERSGDITVIVNAQTKIAGSPKVDDLVDVVASVGTSNAYTALSIIPVSTDRPPKPGLHFRGTVKVIAASAWTVTVEGGSREVTLQITPETKITGDPKVGDRVEVSAAVDASGAFKAISIAKL